MIYFNCGLPRSGSTLIQEILNQNPNIYGSATSGLSDVFTNVLLNWDKNDAHKALPIDDDSRSISKNDLSQVKKNNVLKAILNSYHSETGKNVIIDKNRSWLSHVETLEAVLGEKPKFIVPVRDIRDILASLEKLYRQTKKHRIPTYFDTLPNGQTVEKIYPETVARRCELWMNEVGGIVAVPYLKIQDAMFRGHKNQLLFVQYEVLCDQPEGTLEEIYNFLDLEPFEHDFNNIVQTTYENDRIYGMDLHTIQPSITKSTPKWPTYLGKDVANNFKNMELW